MNYFTVSFVIQATSSEEAWKKAQAFASQQNLTVSYRTCCNRSESEGRTHCNINQGCGRKL